MASSLIQAVAFSGPAAMHPPSRHGYGVLGGSVPTSLLRMPTARRHATATATATAPAIYAAAAPPIASARPPPLTGGGNQRVLGAQGLEALDISADILDDLLQNYDGGGGGGGGGGGPRHNPHTNHHSAYPSNMDRLRSNVAGGAATTRGSPGRDSGAVGTSGTVSTPNDARKASGAHNNVSWIHSSGTPIAGSSSPPSLGHPSFNGGGARSSGGDTGSNTVGGRQWNISDPQTTSPPSISTTNQRTADHITGEYASFLAHATASLMPLVEQSHRSGLPLSFELQAQVRDTLATELVLPLGEHHAQRTQNLEDDAVSAKARLAESSMELAAATRAHQQLAERVRTMIAAPLADSSVPSAAGRGGEAAAAATNGTEGSFSRADEAGGGEGGGGLEADLEGHLRMLKREAANARRKLAQTEAETIRLRHTEGTYLAEVKALQEQVDAFRKASQDTREMFNENEELKSKCAAFEQRLEREREVHVHAQGGKPGEVPQLRELTAMLQESHTSLAATNEHLLRQLEAERFKHAKELEQLRWNYDELKRTADLLA